MATTYSDSEYVYGASMADDITSGGMGVAITAGVGFVPEEVLDAAMAAFFNVINGWLPVTATQKTCLANGNSGWSWTPAAP
jgi:hypothetical protein